NPEPVSDPSDLKKSGGSYHLGQWQPSLTKETYHAAIKRIKEAIAAGDTYQVNYTFPLHNSFSGDDFAFFTDLAAAQQADYAAYLDLGHIAICSASPELFFKLDGDQLTSKPMKGTAVRGRTLAEDNANINWLAQSEKNRAENVMIVDMIRNDMGRVAQVGSIQVPQLFDVERYPTVLQMTSTVTATTNASVTDILTNMFPCASITGAPKVRTMEIIRELEPHPRGVYTGSIGYIFPNRLARFNVAIRTVVIDREQQQATYGVGGGIVWDSVTADEYEECRTKARVLKAKRPSFQLLESLLWQPSDGYFLLTEHLLRLTQSAEYFSFPIDVELVEKQLHQFAEQLSDPAKVRLLMHQNGKLDIEAAPLSAGMGALPDPLNIGLAANSVQSDNIWLYHKTTHRQVYADARAASPDCDELILWNERGELTEATSSNIVLKLKGELVTPPVSAGLLAGTMRGCLLQNGRIHERTLTIDDLHRAQTIYLINSVRKWRTAVLLDPQSVL
ncbi:MAG: aminodeoxychorismate synthase component I, partial [Chloroflexi bacterium]|nr:aminodeoxychorismate synthase component I [Chloroflexota bacterium]